MPKPESVHPPGFSLATLWCLVACCTLLAACGGGGGGGTTSTTPPPATPTVTIDVFGARGGLLTAIATSPTCSATPTISWQTVPGTTGAGTPVSLGTGPTLNDTSPASALSATASCGGGTATQTLKPQSVFSSLAAFAVLQNGKAFAWGSSVWGGSLPDGTNNAPILPATINQIYPSERGFAALLSDGTVRAWGSSYISVADPTFQNPGTNDMASETGPLTNIATIFPGRDAYFALKSDGSFVAWGSYRSVIDGSSVMMNDPSAGLTAAQIASLSKVVSISSTEGAYAALLSDGSIVTFGDPDAGGDPSVWQSTPTNVAQVAGTNFDFVAVLKNGTVVGPNSGTNYLYGYAAPSTALTNIKSVFTNGSVGVALTTGGTATAFGDSMDVDAADSSAVVLTNVSNIFHTQAAFAALKIDGSVVSWGDKARTGTSLAAALPFLVSVTAIQTTDYAFAALTASGSVFAWGDSTVGGDTSQVSAKLSGVVAITANNYAFAALKGDGTVVTWGMASKGGDSSSVASSLVNVRAIYATPLGAFLAIKKDGTFVTWGDQWAGGGSAAAGLTTIPY